MTRATNAQAHMYIAKRNKPCIHLHDIA